VPSHALAMALFQSEVSQRVDEPIGSELAARYLRGETLDMPGPDGWVLIAVEGFPLGWGKRSGGVVKNHYPKILRRG
jgi:NOL1/NOP2/fmu family ribosome biogenesis protein